MFARCRHHPRYSSARYTESLVKLITSVTLLPYVFRPAVFRRLLCRKSIRLSRVARFLSGMEWEPQKISKGVRVVTCAQAEKT